MYAFVQRLVVRFFSHSNEFNIVATVLELPKFNTWQQITKSTPIIRLYIAHFRFLNNKPIHENVKIDQIELIINVQVIILAAASQWPLPTTVQKQISNNADTTNVWQQ